MIYSGKRKGRNLESGGEPSPQLSQEETSKKILS